MVELYSSSARTARLHRDRQRQRRLTAERRPRVVGRLVFWDDVGGWRRGRGNCVPGRDQWDKFNHSPYVYRATEGATPLGTLALSAGVLFGTTETGGTHSVGTVFRLNTDGTAFTNLYNFTNGLDGGAPAAGLVLSGNALYGTVSGGIDSGKIFKINTDGTGFTNLYSFSALVTSTNNDGNAPLSGLVLGGDTLYGAAFYGGPGGGGTLFRINTNGTGFTNLYSFNTVVPSSSNSVDGANPAGSLVLSGNTLYGTASSGGTVTGTKGVGRPRHSV